MSSMPSAEQSYWQAITKSPTYSTLDHDLSIDVVIVGGGITGLTAAYLLKQAGKRVAVLEKNTIGSGTTGATTGKVTSQHGLIYSSLQERIGKKHTKLYAEANQQALKEIAAIIKREYINCGWQTRDNYVYTTEADQISQFKREAKVAASVGLPASFEPKLDLPIPVKGAVKFSDQAQFNALAYVAGLAKAVQGQGSYVFEHTNAMGFEDGSPAKVRTYTKTVTAQSIILASKIPPGPLVARLGYAALEHPTTSYIMAGNYSGKLKGMYISPDKGQYSILPVTHNGQQLLFIGGEHHTPGLGNAKHRYEKLADYARKHFGIEEIAYRWKAMDYLPYDDVPIIGKLYLWSKAIYVATGYKKWGLTTSMVAGSILRDEIMGASNTWSEVFDSTRIRPILSIPHAIVSHR